MKIFTFSRLFLIAFFLFISASVINAQPVGGKWIAASGLPLLTNAHMIFADSTVGYYVGNDTGYVTKDGALTWTKLTLPSNAALTPVSVIAPNHNTVIIFQQSGLSIPGVLTSTDQGTTWTITSSESSPTIKTINMWDANDGFMIWLDNANKDYSAATHDGGKTFTDVRTDPTLEKYISKLVGGSPLTIHADWSDSLHGIVSVIGKSASKAYPVLLTSDGGKSWSEHYLQYNGDSTIKFSYAYLNPGSSSVWVLPTPLVATYYYFSSDFGATWVTSDTLQGNASNYSYLLRLAPVSANAVWGIAIGNSRNPATSQNVIMYKETAGNWVTVTSIKGSGGGGGGFGNAYTVTDMQFADPYHGWVIATYGTIDSIFFYQYKAPFTINGVTETAENNHLHCVPNPASSTIKIEGFNSDEKITDVTLNNTLGKQISCDANTVISGIELNVSYIPNGCYFVNIKTSTRKETVPIMVVH